MKMDETEGRRDWRHATSQHDGESKAFGHQRQSDAIRWPTPDCGLGPMRAVVGWMGSVTGVQRSSRTGLLLPLERKRGVGEQESLGTYQIVNLETKR